MHIIVLAIERKLCYAYNSISYRKEARLSSFFLVNESSISNARDTILSILHLLHAEREREQDMVLKQALFLF